MSKSTDEVRCIACRYLEPLNSLYGECRRYPPLARDEHFNAEGNPRLPIVRPLFWCGEFKPIDRQSGVKFGSADTQKDRIAELEAELRQVRRHAHAVVAAWENPHHVTADEREQSMISLRDELDRH